MNPRTLATVVLTIPCMPAQDFVPDPHSFARPREARVTHAQLHLKLDFERKQVHGTVGLTVENADARATLRLDTAGLDVQSVADAGGKKLAFRLGDEEPVRGRELAIQLEQADQAVTIAYATRPDAAALQWLTPEQTAARKGPFLYTQGQAILTRSWIPLQDSPGIRITFDAWVTAPKDATVVMAAAPLPKDGDEWRFQMQQPIPPYLIALACGAIESRDISKRCRVYAEPTVIARAAKELEDLETMVAACESLFGPYLWERYDVLILPPSFPFGGMENPRLTFATPTILAGDKSLVALIAHELAHSWSGNLVTNATWRDFWLNEGFTVYVEGRIMERVYGKERAAMEALIGLEGLKREMKDLPEKDQVLHIDLEGRNPDDGMTQIAYEKGALFLRVLEERFGREKFDRFLTAWFAQHRFQSVPTARFVEFLKRELAAGDEKLLGELRVEEWLRRPGLPANAPIPKSDALAATDRERKAFQDGKAASALQTKGWVTQQWLHFLDGMPPTLTTPQLAQLDEAFGFTASENAEVLCTWLVLAAKHGYAPAAARTERFLLEVGRRKYLKPIYEALAKTEAGKREALRIYALARPRYHSVATRTLDALLAFKQ